MCTTSSRLNVMLHFYFFILTYMSSKNINFQVLRRFFSVITVNVLNKDKGLIQIRRLEKVQHIESAHSAHPSHWLTIGLMYNGLSVNLAGLPFVHYTFFLITLFELNLDLIQYIYHNNTWKTFSSSLKLLHN